MTSVVPPPSYEMALLVTLRELSESLVGAGSVGEALILGLDAALAASGMAAGAVYRRDLGGELEILARRGDSTSPDVRELVGADSAFLRPTHTLFLTGSGGRFWEIDPEGGGTAAILPLTPDGGSFLSLTNPSPRLTVLGSLSRQALELVAFWTGAALARLETGQARGGHAHPPFQSEGGTRNESGAESDASPAATSTASGHDESLRFFAENTGDVLWILDPETLRFLYISPSVTRLRGLTPEEIMAAPLDEALDAETAARVRQQVAERVAAHASGEAVATDAVFYTEQVRQPHKDGSWIWTEVTTRYFRNPRTGRLEVLGVTRDITQWLHDQSELRDSEARYRTLFENAGDAIVILQDGTFQDCNRRALDLFGCDRSQLIGSPPERFSPPAQLDGRSSKDHADERIAAALAGRAQFFEWAHCRLDGTPFAAEVSLNAIGTKQGAIVQAIVRDVTARKAAEAQLQQALEEVSRLRDLLQIENVSLRQEVRSLHGQRTLIGESAALRRALWQVKQVATTDSTVLLSGETGTGKELFAAEIHALSARRDRPMVRVNCAALPANLVESELFGHDRGAFTGATTRQIGRFEAASGSTIFLDEIGEIPPEAQVKLLRVLQEREIERLGSPTPIKVDVRVIAATNRDLEAEVRAGRFRQDLFYRLNVFPIVVPPLRERPDDIPALVWAFVDEFAGSMGKHIDAIAEADLEAVKAHAWPGNVRELRNIVERSMIVATGRTLRLQVPAAGSLGSACGSPEPRLPSSQVAGRELLVGVLESCGWRVRGAGGAAEILGLKPTTLETRMAKLGIHRPGRAPRT